MALETGHFPVTTMSCVQEQSVAFSLWQDRVLLPSGQIPLYLTPVSAGFPSPADSFIEKLLDLNEYCIENPISTYFVRVKDSAWGDLGVAEGDILIVDRGLEPGSGGLVLADVEGERLLVRINVRQGRRELTDNLGRVHIAGESVLLWGTVTYILRRMR